MSAFTKTVANFAAVVLIISFSLYFNDQLCYFHTELHEISVACRQNSVFISDVTRFTAKISMAEGKFYLPPVPSDVLKIPEWLKTVGQHAMEAGVPHKISGGLTEFNTYSLMFIIGRYYDQTAEMWAPDKAEIAKLTAKAIIERCPGMPIPVQQQLKLDETRHHFTDRRAHQQMQVSFRKAVMTAVEGHFLSRAMIPLNANILDTNLYQGSRLFAALMIQFSSVIEGERVHLAPAALGLCHELKENQDPTTAEVLDIVTRLEQHIQTLSMAGQVDEVPFVRNFISVLRMHRRPNIVAAVNAASQGAGGHQANTVA